MRLGISRKLTPEYVMVMSQYSAFPVLFINTYEEIPYIPYRTLFQKYWDYIFKKTQPKNLPFYSFRVILISEKRLYFLKIGDILKDANGYEWVVEGCGETTLLKTEKPIPIRDIRFPLNWYFGLDLYITIKYKFDDCAYSDFMKTFNDSR